MGNLYESKLMKKLQGFGERIAGNKVFSSISNGMMICMGLILAGSVCQIIATVPTIFQWFTTESTIYKTLMVPYNMTMGIVSLVIVFSIAYNYSKMLGMKPLVNGSNAMILFLMVAAPAKTVLLSDNTTDFTGLDTTALGGAGIFTAVLVGILSVKLTHFFEKRHITIKMPEVVPQFLQDSFSTLIPLIVNIILWHGLNTLVVKVFTVNLPIAVNALLSMPLKALTSAPGMIVIVFIALLLWTFGIHGTMVVYIAIMPTLIQFVTNNAALVAEGRPAVFAPIALFGALACCGGTGNVLPLVVMGLRSKSEQLKAISKAGIIPAIFNISEPVMFGFPIMYNPIMAIPFILAPIITMIILWGGYAVGFFKPGYVLIMSAMPIGVNEFLSAMSWQNIFIPVVGFIVGFIVFTPFFKAYERQLIKKEAAMKAAENTEEGI